MGFVYAFERDDGGIATASECGIFKRVPLRSIKATACERDVNGRRRSLVVYHHAAIPEHAAWRRSLCDRFWLGWDRDNPPGPNDLRNDYSVAGVPVELRDGNLWMIPLVLPATDVDKTRLTGLPLEPRQINDVVTWRPLSEFDTLIIRAASLLKQLYATHDDKTDSDPPLVDPRGGDVTDNMFPYVCDLLGVSYRVTADEVLALQLLDYDRAAQSIAVSLDLNVRRELAPRD